MTLLAPGWTIPADEAAWIAREVSRHERHSARRRLLVVFARAIVEGDAPTRLRAVAEALALEDRHGSR